MSVVSIRGIDVKTYRKVKAIAALRGIRVADAVNEALKLWLSVKPPLMAELEEIEEEAKVNRRAYEAMKDHLFSKYKGLYVTFSKGRFLGAYKTLEEAAEAVENAGGKHGLIELVGEEEVEKVNLGWSLIELE
ncbi:MAG: hypothetical protein DRJ63_07585 [Thermoprotei archaeon]|nr:MAG: hypothetical protein DRJ63_07585 [Thermoprotei archaeon]